MTTRAGVRLALSAVVLCACVGSVQARTVYRCVQAGTVSLSTAPEPDSRCRAIEVDDLAPLLPDLWGAIGIQQGFIYSRVQDGRTVYGTREFPGAVKLQAYSVSTPTPAWAHAGLGKVGKPRLDRFPGQFRSAAAATGVDDAWLRAIAHAESYFDPRAVSSKGALGVMQLMPDTARQYGVTDPYSSQQSISAGARHLRNLEVLYDGDRALVAAAYNAGVAAVTRYDGVPPFPETLAYVAKVQALYTRYQSALVPGGVGRVAPIE